MNEIGITLMDVSATDTENGVGLKVSLKAVFPSDLSFTDKLSWVKSIFVSCVSSTNQLSYGKNLIGDRIIFPEDLGNSDVAQSENLIFEQVANLSEIFGLDFSEDEYFVQVSARHLHSPHLLIKLN